MVYSHLLTDLIQLCMRGFAISMFNVRCKFHTTTTVIIMLFSADIEHIDGYASYDYDRHAYDGELKMRSAKFITMEKQAHECSPFFLKECDWAKWCVCMCFHTCIEHWLLFHMICTWCNKPWARARAYSRTRNKTFGSWMYRGTTH